MLSTLLCQYKLQTLIILRRGIADSWVHGLKISWKSTQLLDTIRRVGTRLDF